VVATVRVVLTVGFGVAHPAVSGGCDRASPRLGNRLRMAVNAMYTPPQLAEQSHAGPRGRGPERWRTAISSVRIGQPPSERGEEAGSPAWELADIREN